MALTGDAAAQAPFITLGPGRGTLLDREERDCGELRMNSDGIYDGAYAMTYDGIVPPYWGAFAERYFGRASVCALVLDITQFDTYHGQTMDAYVWNSQEDIPGNVLCLATGIDPGQPAIWPNVSRHVIELEEPCSTGDDWWLGYWGNWPGEYFGWAVGASYHTWLPGYPFTNIAPGIGYPTGWHDVSIIWGPTEAIGIGAQTLPDPTRVARTDWGRIKRLYH